MYEYYLTEFVDNHIGDFAHIFLHLLEQLSLLKFLTAVSNFLSFFLHKYSDSTVETK